MATVVRVVLALVLHAALSCAWLVLVVAIPIYGLWRAAETGEVGWAVSCLVVAGIFAWLWMEISRKVGYKQTFSDDSGPVI